MTITAATDRSALALVLVAALAIIVGGCKSEPAAPAPAETYRTRAQVVSVDGEGEHARVQLTHEAIAAFKDRQGKPGPMPAMTMAFGLGQGVDKSLLAPGSKHDVTFDVVWTREPALRVTAVQPLPEDTSLELPASP